MHYLELDFDTIECCALAHIHGFPYDKSRDWEKRYKQLVLEDLTDAAQTSRESGKSMLLATTVQTQQNAAAVLESLGFIPSKPARRDLKYSGNTNEVILWHKHLVED